MNQEVVDKEEVEIFYLATAAMGLGIVVIGDVIGIKQYKNSWGNVSVLNRCFQQVSEV